MRSTTKLIICLLVLLRSAHSLSSHNALNTDQYYTNLYHQQKNELIKNSPVITHDHSKVLHNFLRSYDSALISRNRKIKRQAEVSSNSDFTWKVAKPAPQFVTTKLNEQNAKPTLKVYPPDVVYRTGRSRELVLPQRNDLTRVIYYAPLPEVTRQPLNSNRRFSDYPQMPVSLQLNQHRSYDPTKAGKDFVTRVQSSIIDVRPRGEIKKDISSTPTFTIIDANPTPHPVGLDRIMYSDMYQNMIPNMEKDRHMIAYPYQKPFSAFRPQYPIPYYAGGGGVIIGNIDKSQYNLGQYQYQPQSSPFYHEVEKINLPIPHQHQHNQHTTFLTSSYYSSSPYPTRHNRFPPDRYPLTSSLPFTSVETSLPPQRPSNLDVGEPGSFSIDGPSTHSSQLSGSGFDLDDNLGGSLDHSSLDLENHNRPGSSLHPLSFKNKFADYSNFVNSGSPIGGQKYTDFNGFNNDFPFKVPGSPSLKPQFSQVSDWLTNKPSLDLSSFDLEDFNAAAAAASAAAIGGQDYHIKGTSSSNSADTASNNQSGTTDPSKDVTNTILTPFTSSFSNSSEENRAN